MNNAPARPAPDTPFDWEAEAERLGLVLIQTVDEFGDEDLRWGLPLEHEGSTYVDAEEACRAFTDDDSAYPPANGGA